METARARNGLYPLESIELQHDNFSAGCFLVLILLVPTVKLQNIPVGWYLHIDHFSFITGSDMEDNPWEELARSYKLLGIGNE